MLQTREFVNNKQPIYKIGRTQQPLLTRFNQYSKGSVLIIHINVKDSRISEKEIISVFTKQFTCKKDLGREYFEGDISKMKKCLCEICCREDETQNEYENDEDKNNTESINKNIIEMDKETHQGKCKCPRCERTISKKHIKKHIEICKGVPRNTCGVCFRIFTTQQSHSRAQVIWW
jgi:hypothetical protein